MIGNLGHDDWDFYNRYHLFHGHPEPSGRPNRTCCPQSSRLARMLQCREGSSRVLRHTATSVHGAIRRAVIIRIACLRPQQCLSSPFLLIHGPMWSRREFAFADTSVRTCGKQDRAGNFIETLPACTLHRGIASSARFEWNRQSGGREHDDGMLANLL